MRSPPSSPSPSRSRTSRVAPLAALLLACAGAAGCGGDDGEACGPGEAPPDGITLAVGAEEVTFGEVRSSPNNDCTPPGEDGPTSLTIEAAQLDPAYDGPGLILCLPRPDELGAGPVPLNDASLVEVIDLFGQDAAGCDLRLDRMRSAGGSITFTGLCEAGVHPDGYAIELAATLPVTRTCPGDPASEEEASLTGTAAVSAGPL